MHNIVDYFQIFPIVTFIFTSYKLGYTIRIKFKVRTLTLEHSVGAVDNSQDH